MRVFGLLTYIYIYMYSKHDNDDHAPFFFDRDGIFFLISPTAAVSTIPYVFYCAENGLFLDFSPFFFEEGRFIIKL